MHELNDHEPRFTDTPGDGVVPRMQRERRYSQAVRIAPAAHDRIETSGQGGWDASLRFPTDLGEEIALAFDNVETILREAGATWEHVIALDSFHVTASGVAIEEEHTDAIVAQLQARMPHRRPIWTELGVRALGAPGMRVEIRVTALVPHGEAAERAA